MSFHIDLDERVIATLPFGIVIQNPRGEIALANPAAQQILGLTMAQMQGRTSVDPRWQATREDGSPFPGTEHPSMVSLRTGQAVNDVIMRVFNPAKNMARWINVNAAPIRDADEHVTAVYAVFEDVTDKKTAERALRESEARLKHAERLAHLGNWELDLVSGRLVWSDEIFRIFEIDPARVDASYEAFLNCIHPDDRDEVNRAYTRSLSDRLPCAIDHRLLMSDGRVKHVREQCVTDVGVDGT